MSVAKTILAQLGGNKFITMVGATNLINIDNIGLRFKFKGCRDMNVCAITLEADDTYRVRFFKLYNFDFKEKASYDGVYNSQLVSLFERKTGLATTL